MDSVHTVLLGCLVFLAGKAKSACPSGTTFQESCYIISKGEANWIGAVENCKALGGNLVSIDSAEENNFIAKLIADNNQSKPIQYTSPPNIYKYHYLENEGVNIRGHSSITFLVQSCTDAHVALSETQDSHVTTYEIVIGGWADSQSVIRDCMQCAHMDEVKQYDHPLDCRHQRPFWLSWEDGHVQLGTGRTVGEEGFLSWRDPGPHPVNYLGVSSGWGSPGVWNFTISTYWPGVFWLGATDLQVEGEWARLPDLDQVSFTNWDAGQPSGGQYRHCAAMDGARSLKWIDADCEAHRNYICELEAFQE